MGVDRQLDRLEKDVTQVGAVVYQNLPPEERFPRIIQAEAADDDTEVKRLIDTCPKKTYSQRDAAVMDRVEGLSTLVVTFCVDLSVPLAKLQMLKGQAMLLDYLRNRENDELCQAWWNGYTHGHGGAPPETEDVDLLMPNDAPAAEWFLGVTERLIYTLETVVLEQWEAFSRFCREDLVLEPETVLRACMAPVLERVQSALAEMESIHPDATAVEEHRDILGKLWRRLVGLEGG